jgi:hypothetical protein
MVANTKPIDSKDSYIKQHAHKISKSPNINEVSMDKLRSMDPQMALKTLADHGIVFSPEDFSHYLFGKRINPKTVEGMKTHLPDAFKTHEDDGEVTNNEKFEPDFAGHIPGEFKKLIEGLQEGHSLKEGPAVRRIMIISISNQLQPHSPEAKTKEASDKELAKQYTAYKLATLNYMNEHDQLDDDILLNAVLQNR